MTHKVRLLIIIALVVTAFDQLTKAAIMARLMENQMIEVVPGFFNIVFFMNPGAAFGIFDEGGWLGTAFLIAVTVVSLVVVAVLVRQSHDDLLTVGLSLVAGGAVGNLIDRVRFGEVVDFLDFQFGSFHWPAFNVADSAITVGVIVAVFSYYFRGHEGQGTEK